ncbi:MAG: type II secretion system F family protein [Candidatus Pacearchaeota archaeon]
MATKIQIIGVVIGVVMAALSFIFFYNTKVLWFLIGIAIIVAVIPFVSSIIIGAGREKEKEEMFLSFSLDLVGSVKAGAPISKSIIQISKKDYGSLTPHVKKLANQVSLAIPVRQALRTFASDINNKVISRSVELIIEAEASGGEIGRVIDAVVKSVTEIEDLKKERASRVFGMVVQGYIIFFIFVAIMLFVEIKFMPLITGALAGTELQAGAGGVGGMGVSLGGGVSKAIMERSFFILLLVQALFAGLVIGKLSEGSIKHGIKHSAILLAVSYLVITATRALVG